MEAIGSLRAGIAVRRGAVGGIALALVLVLAGASDARRPRACSLTARAQFAACQNDLKDDKFEGKAICLNLADKDERRECIDELKVAAGEAREECRDQRDARRDLCGEIGEEPYDPSFDPAGFDDDFSNLTTPNSHYPIAVGNQWKYVGGDETITVEVLDKTKLIEGVTCIVVNDLVEEDGEAIENTDDWLAHALNGDIWYCGEIAQNFEVFPGDDPEEAELVDVEGSWKAGRDGAKAGILFPHMPMVGDVYRQEWAPGDAEDVAQVLATNYGFGNDAALDAFVPQALADLLCNDDCIVTGEFTPIEPDAFEHKYYAPGIGLFLEVEPASGETVQLVDCNVHPTCAMLPAP